MCRVDADVLQPVAYRHARAQQLLERLNIVGDRPNGAYQLSAGRNGSAAGDLEQHEHMQPLSALSTPTLLVLQSCGAHLQAAGQVALGIEVDYTREAHGCELCVL